jgi:hypothetical protein
MKYSFSYSTDTIWRFNKVSNKEEYFLPSTIKAWNNLPLTTNNLESKSLINTQNTKVPSHYYVGCRLGRILLQARLRMNCSALNAHLFIRNLVESPNCKTNVCKNVVESYTIYLKIIIQRDWIRLKRWKIVVLESCDRTI